MSPSTETSSSRAAGALPAAARARRLPPRLDWELGLLTVSALPLEPARAVAPDAPLRVLAERMRVDQAGFALVVDGERLVGVVFEDALLDALAHGALDGDARRLLAPTVPSCSPASALVDAVRLMLDARLRKLPVVEAGRLVGLLPLAVAVAAAERDPAVRDTLERMATSPSLFARAWH